MDVMTTKIEWTDETWNPMTGCTPISAGCKNCYAKRMANRLRGRFGYGDEDPFAITLRPDRLHEPFKWKKPRHVFVCSMGDLFHTAIHCDYINRVFDVIHRCPQHIFQILTKRPCFAKHRAFPFNTWLGTTVERWEYTGRIDDIRASHARVKFLSLEPLLGPLPDLELESIDWVIVGAETGPEARKMDIEWAVDIRDQCLHNCVPFFFKKDSAGSRLLKGKEWNEMPNYGKISLRKMRE